MKNTETPTGTNSEQPLKLLLVEDDSRLAASIQEYLQQNEFRVDIESRGDTAVETILKAEHDLVILDLMLPGIDGLEVCRQVRQTYHKPILMLTARDDSIEQIVGLEIGADDYVTKPVEPRILLARIRALLRHARRAVSSTNHPSMELCFGKLTISHGTRTVVWLGHELKCTEIEFELLWLLASNAGQVLSRDHIFETLIGYEYDGLDRSIDIRISRLRKLFDNDSSEPSRIKTVRGKGYLFIESAWE